MAPPRAPATHTGGVPAEPRRAVRPVVAWVAAAMVAVAVASWGVAHVGRSVTDSRPAPLSATEVEERLAAAATTTTTADPASPPSAGTAAPTESTAPATAGPSSPGTTVVLGGPAVVAPQPPEPAPGASPTTTAPPPPTTVPAPGETRTYALVGGTVSLRFEASGVTVAFASPAAGFEVEVEPEHGNGVKVEFESETHRSRVTGWWDGGPRDEVDERADGDD